MYRRLFHFLLVFSLLACAPTPSGKKGNNSNADDLGGDQDGFSFGTSGSGTGADDIQGSDIDTPVPEDSSNGVDSTDSAVAPPDISTPEDIPTQPTIKDISGGLVIVEISSSQLNQATVNAAFITGKAPEEMPVADFGECKVIYSNGSSQSTPTPGLDGGAISVTGLNSALNLTANPAGNGVLYQSGLPANQEKIFGNGLIQVNSAGGSEVPAWSAQTTTPQAVFISQPKGGDIFDPIDKSKALLFQWNAGNGSAINIHLFVASTSGDPVPGNTVTCTIEGDSGSFSVPAGAVNMLPSGGGGLIPDKLLIFAVSRITSKEVTLPGQAGKASVIAIRTSADGTGIN